MIPGVHWWLAALARLPACLPACLPGCVQLKDEVVVLKAAVASRDAQLSAAADAAAGMKSELEQYHSQVGRSSPTPGG
jgi:tagatose-1,6-bisphosphate aldolase non-catalytic subunit AgaZ/GatZ